MITLLAFVAAMLLWIAVAELCAIMGYMKEVDSLKRAIEIKATEEWSDREDLAAELTQVKSELADKKAEFERLKIDAGVASEALVRMESMFNEKADELYKLKEKYQQVLFDNHRIKMEVTEMCGDLMAIAKMADSQDHPPATGYDDPPF